MFPTQATSSWRPDQIGCKLRVRLDTRPLKRGVPLDTILLTWHGPFSLIAEHPSSLFTVPISTEPGLYLWTVPTATGHLIQYVGETAKSFRARHRDHLRAYKRGAYSIHRATSLAEGRRDPVYSGFLWSRKRRSALEPWFMEHRAGLMAELAQAFKVFALFLAPLHAQQRIRRRVETAIVRLLLAQGGPEAAFLDDELSSWDRLPEEPPIAVNSAAAEVLRGLPAMFEA